MLIVIGCKLHGLIHMGFGKSFNGISGFFRAFAQGSITGILTYVEGSSRQVPTLTLASIARPSPSNHHILVAIQNNQISFHVVINSRKIKTTASWDRRTRMSGTWGKLKIKIKM